jgi:hypothetical protein
MWLTAPPPALQLVLINISDHHTRMRANPAAGAAPGAPVVVLGCLLGSQTGRTVDVSNSFEIKYAEGAAGAFDVDQAFLLKRQEQCERPPPQRALAAALQQALPARHGVQARPAGSCPAPCRRQ